MYQTFIGIDVGKDFIDVVRDSGEASKGANPQRFPNDGGGFASLEEAFPDLGSAFVVLESTGGYEREILARLLARGAAAHRADTRKAKAFVRSLGQNGKTDSLDARALAGYARERHGSLPVYVPPAEGQARLQALRARRDDLSAMLVQEKNRLSSPACKDVLTHIQKSLAFLEQAVEDVDLEIDGIVSQDPDMRQKRETLVEIPGVGKTTANALLAFMPELGTLDRKKAASLAGLAPHPNESGKSKGLRRIKGGRKNLRNALYLAAMGVANSKNNALKEFYLRLKSAGKKPIVALTAVMRKIVVLANAKIRDLKNCATA